MSRVLSFSLIFLIALNLKAEEAVIKLGRVGPTQPIDVEKIHEQIKVMKDVFSYDGLLQMHDYMKKQDKSFFEDLAQSTNTFYDNHTHFKTKLKQRKQHNKTREVKDDLPFDTMVLPGTQLFFFSASNYHHMNIARNLGPMAYGFCIDWNSYDEIAQFKQQVGQQFMFLVMSDDDMVNNYNIKEYPALITVNDDRTYTLEIGY